MIDRAARRILLALVAGATAASCAAPRSAAPPGTSASGPVAAPPADESFRAQPPAPDPPRPFVPPIAAASTLPNGMGLLVLERHAAQLVSAQLVVRGGTTAFPSEPPEALSMMADMTIHGTKTLSERQVYETMGQRFFELRTSIGDSWLEFTVRALSPSFFAALDLMHDVALNPAFSPDSLELLRQRFKVYFELHANDPDRIATVNLYAAVFGESNPYTRYQEGSVSAVEKLTRDEIVRAWKEEMDPTEAVLVVVGDVDAAAVRERVETLFNGWKRDSSLPARVPPPAPTPAAARVIVVDRPGASLATVLYGAGAAPIDSPQTSQQIILRNLMGGMRSSAVKERLREQVDPGYSPNSKLRALVGGGVIWWQNDVPEQEAAPLLTALDAQVRGLRDPGPTPEELASVKTLIARALPRSLETVSALSERFAEIAAYRFPPDEIVRHEAAVAAATPESVRAAVPDPKDWKAIVVGDLASLRAPLLALGWGPLEERDSHGKVLRTIGP